MYQNKFKVKDVPKTMLPKKTSDDGESENVGLRQSLALDISNSEKFPR